MRCPPSVVLFFARRTRREWAHPKSRSSSLGTALRIEECLELHVKDLDFDRHQIVVRQGKGQKDRVTMLPSVARKALTQHLADVRRLHQADLARGLGRVILPLADDDLSPREATWRAGREESDGSAVTWMRASFARIHRSIDCAAGLELVTDQSLAAIRFHRVRD